MKFDFFLAAMLVAVLLAILAPSVGAAGGPLHLEVVTATGIAIVFFIHGAMLSPGALKAGAANWRLHLFVQATTFLLFPAIGFALFILARDLLPQEIRLGFFYLCALPSAISSSIALTAVARGNVPGAIFNATLSGLIGMLLTPALIAIVASTDSTDLPLLPAILDVFEKLLLPFAAGQLCRPVIGRFMQRHKGWVTMTDRSVIVIIVYAAFCESTAAGLWSRYAPAALAGIILMVLVLLAVILAFTITLARRLGFSREDEIAAVFCGTKKSLVNGAPIAAILFGSSVSIGMILLPLMLYHQAQLIVCAILARRYARVFSSQVESRDDLRPVHIESPLPLAGGDKGVGIR